MRIVKIISQIVFLLLLVGSILFLDVPRTVYTVTSQWFLQLNPLAFLLTSLASRTVVAHFLPGAGIITIGTLVFGRFFCGMVCPLGTIIDFSDRYLWGRKGPTKSRPPVSLHRFKYAILALFIVLAVFGVIWPLFFDPVSQMTRFVTLILYPLIKTLGAQGQSAFAPLLYRLGMDDATMATIAPPLYYGITGILIFFLIIVSGLGFWDRRFFCQYLCPSGAFFGLLSRVPLFKRHIGGECSSCQRCSRSCPTRAINEKAITKTTTAECILCGNCTSLKDSCNTFAFYGKFKDSTSAPDIKRRNVLFGFAAGLSLLPVFKSAGLTKTASDGRLIRPPGAMKEADFLSRCLGCGQCMKVCPTNGLQPCTFSDGAQVLLTPKLAPKIGACEEKCYACGHVCPTEAIRKLPYEEKRFAKIGTAVVDKQRCLAWEENRECVVCDEVCPYKAVKVQVEQTTKRLFKVPVVTEDLCMGCGECENHCPVLDKSAIIVYRAGENRQSWGAYMTDTQKQDLTKRRRASDDKLSFSATDSNRSVQSGMEPLKSETDLKPLESPEAAEPKSGKAPENGLPPGFTN